MLNHLQKSVFSQSLLPTEWKIGSSPLWSRDGMLVALAKLRQREFMLGHWPHITLNTLDPKHVCLEAQLPATLWHAEQFSVHWPRRVYFRQLWDGVKKLQLAHKQKSNESLFSFGSGTEFGRKWKAIFKKLYGVCLCACVWGIFTFLVYVWKDNAIG